MKKCPFCAEQIQDEAIKCRFCGSMLTSGAIPAPPAMNDGMWQHEVRGLLAQGQKISAIKVVRQQTGCGLKDAKDYVEAIERGESPPVPQPTERTSGAGCASVFVVVLIATILFLHSRLFAAAVRFPVQHTAADDVEIYQTILEEKIRPEVVRMTRNLKAGDRPALLVLDSTYVACDQPHPKSMGCIGSDADRFQNTPKRAAVFSDRLTAPTLAELDNAFHAAISASAPLPAALVPEAILVTPDRLEAELALQSSQTTGFSGFSRPAFSSDGHAVVYGSYVCGGLCGYGWLFLLQRTGDSWRVLSTQMLWIS